MKLNLSFLPAQSRQRYFLWVFIGVVLIGAVMVWYLYFREETISIFQGASAPPPKEVSLDFTIFESPIFQELGTPISEIPVPEGSQRQNPFTPN